MNQDLTSYYRARAKEYDKVYSIPEEQHDLHTAATLFRELLNKKKVLEIACGTGYWTQQLSEATTSILATDINEAVIEIAKKRIYAGHVSFQVADMYNLTPGNSYDALFGGFIWSHIPVQDLDRFLFKISNLLKPGAIITFIDSKKVKGGIHDTIKTETDEQGNSYQERVLENKTTHWVLKNFPSRDFLIQQLSKISIHINYMDLEHYWITSGVLKPGLKKNY